MPDPALICEVRTKGGIYRDWVSVQVDQNFLSDGWSRSFRLVCAEPSQVKNLRLAPGDRVDIALAGHVVIKEGYIGNRQAAYDANRHAVQITGYSRGGLITETSIDGGTGQYRGYKIDAIANAVLKPHGLTFRVQNGNEGWDTPFSNVMVRNGESPFSLIARLCKQRNLFFAADAKGNLVAGPKDEGGLVRFEEGVNILAASCSLDYPAVRELVTNSQQPGSDSLFGRGVAEISAKATVTNGPAGLKRKLLAEMPLDQRGAQLRTNWEAAKLEALSQQVQVTYQGWLKPGVGGLWDITDGVSLKSPMLFPTGDGTQILKLAGYSYQQSEGGTTTTLDLVNRLAWQQRFPNAKENDGFYSLGTGTAQPEAPA